MLLSPDQHGALCSPFDAASTEAASAGLKGQRDRQDRPGAARSGLTHVFAGVLQYVPPHRTLPDSLLQCISNGVPVLLNVQAADAAADMGLIPNVHYFSYSSDSSAFASPSVPPSQFDGQPLSQLLLRLADARSSEAVEAVRQQARTLVISRHSITHRAAAVAALLMTRAGEDEGVVV